MRAMSADEIKDSGLAPDRMALLIDHVDQYGDHSIAKRSGFLKDDFVISFDGRTESMRETEVFAHILREGTRVELKVIRKGKALIFRFDLR